MPPRTVVEEVAFNASGLAEFVADLGQDDPQRKRMLLDFPTVYLVRQPHETKFNVYVGETNDIRQRTLTHLTHDPKVRDDWDDFATDDRASMFVIGNEHFNKSLTLDIESRLMQWLLGAPEIHELRNRRTNPQRDYHTRDELDATFAAIWRRLRKHDPKLFPTESLVRQSALFKASPFHRLTEQQVQAKTQILTAIRQALESRESGQLVLVEGAAGSGKTVLLSNLFHDLFQPVRGDEDAFDFQSLDAYLLVNHDQQLTVYESIATKLGLVTRGTTRVSKPTRFINSHDPASPVDVVLVDEAHLLWTQGKQAYRGRNQLADLVERAKVVVAVFDPDQVMSTTQYWEDDALAEVRAAASRRITLDQQLRINSSAETLLWIRDFIDRGQIRPLPEDAHYDLRVFDSAAAMHGEIKNLAADETRGLSRTIATFDWPFVEKRRPDGGGTWNVHAGDLVLPWNLQIEYSRAEARTNRGLSWAERARTVDECGSHYTVQGFDLNYAGVILGPSVTYRDGHVVFDPSRSANTNATQNRSLANGTKVSVAEQLLRNELNVLLTRGVNGLYLYACDARLQRALLDAQRQRKESARG